MFNIKKLRNQRGISQLQRSEMRGISQAMGATWESGNNNPRADKLPDLARVLGCTVDDLFRDSEREKGA